MCAGDVRSASRDKWLLRCDGAWLHSPIRSPHAARAREMTPAVPVTRSAGETAGGLLHESFGHLRYIRLKKIGRTRRRPLEGARTRGTSAAMPPPTEAREGCPGLVGDACARQLDDGVDGRRPPFTVDGDAAMFAQAQSS